MKWWKTLLFIFLTSYAGGLFAQDQENSAPSTIQMIPEPAVTMSSSNRVFSQQVFGAKTFLFKELNAAKWDTIASSGDPNQYSADVGGLKYGVPYQYRVLFGGELSNIVISTQDHRPPLAAMLLDENYVHQQTMPLQISVKDSVSKSVKRVVLYYRPGHGESIAWRKITEKAIDPLLEASNQNPLLDVLSFTVPDSLGDGLYEFYVAAQDTAWAPAHRPDEPFSGTEGNFIPPQISTQALKQVYVDLHKPVSQIVSPANQYSKSVAFPVQYNAKDSAIGHHDYLGSGIRTISIFVNYKSTPNSAYGVKDSLIKTQTYDSPLLQVGGAVNFVAKKDGFYEFYSLAADTAQNLENNGQPKTDNLPFILVDSAIPLVGSLSLTTEPTIHPAKPGWTNKNQVSFKVTDLQDPEKNGYASGLDSLYLAENLELDQNVQVFPIENGTVNGVYSLTLQHGEKTIYAVANDHADNVSTPVSQSIQYDPQAPVISEFDIPFSLSTNFTIPISVEFGDNFSLDSLFLWINGNPAARDTLPGIGNYESDISLELPHQLGWHTVTAQIRDKAGNVSTIAKDSVKIVDTVSLTDFQITDKTDAEDKYAAAEPGYTDNPDVLLSLTYAGSLLKLQLSKEPSFTDFIEMTPPWNIVSSSAEDTTLLFDYPFTGDDGEKELFFRGFGPQLTDTSNIVQAAILLDTQQPVLQQFQIYQTYNVQDISYQFTNSATVKVHFQSDDEGVSKILLRENETDSLLYQTFFTDSSYTFASPENEQKTLYARVRDRAGNWSPVCADSIILDTSNPEISGFVLSDLSTPGTADTLLTDDVNIEVSFQADDELPGKLFRVIIAQDQQFTANPQEFLFAGGSIQTVQGKLTVTYLADRDYLSGNQIVCWAAVEDSAFNRSQVVSDNINLTEQLNIHATLYDINDPLDSLYSSAATVNFTINPVSGVYEEIAYSQQSGQFTNWQPVSLNQPFSSTYTFDESSTYFEARLYVAARNSAGQMAVDSSSIFIDRASPEIDSIVVVATKPQGEQTYSNSRNVKVVLNVHDLGKLQTVYLSEDSTFASADKFTIFSQNGGSASLEVDFELSAQNGNKIVFARVTDFAENVSLVKSDQIEADYDPDFVVTNHPNPFNPTIESTTVVVKTEGSSEIEMNIYDLFGNLVREIKVPAGERYNQVQWDGRNGKGEWVANGGYICIVKTAQRTMTRKIAVMK